MENVVKYMEILKRSGSGYFNRLLPDFFTSLALIVPSSVSYLSLKRLNIVSSSTSTQHSKSWLYPEPI